ncbi:A1S_2505 family phage non-structural protein [Prevotella communis]|uniref:A1S_2505 family phage non-structural protein n=1 Tax=Prevotella communis TaxID=2913614 RepID=UPI0032AF0362
MEEQKYIGFTPDYIDRLLSNQIFVFGSNTLGYHTGGASRTARKKFGAVWGLPEGLQGQSYAIPVDFGKGVRNDVDVKAAVDRFISFAKEHTELFFLVTRVGCGTGGYHDDEMAQFFKEALKIRNISLPRSFVDALNGGEINYNLERFLKAQDSVWGSYSDALKEIKEGHKRSHWIWYIFPQIKGLGHSSNSEFYGISNKDEAKAYLEHPVLGLRLRDITKALLDCNNPSASNILGFPDVLKVQSCMTLFDLVLPNDIFDGVLDKYYEGKRCERTIKRLGFHEEKLKNQIKLSRLTITREYTIMLSDYNKEVKLEPIVKAVYLLFLNHPEGIAFKCLPDYRKELAGIYQKIKPLGLTERAIRSIEDVTNPLLNSINEKCSRIRAIFQSEVDASLLDQYIITGKSGEAKKISLLHDLVVWE